MQQISAARLLDFAGKINAVYAAMREEKEVLSQGAGAVGSGKKVRSDCEKAGRVWLEVYFLDFLIHFFCLEIDGGYFLIGADYEKIEKLPNVQLFLDAVLLKTVQL